jgi:hypothetical protein
MVGTNLRCIAQSPDILFRPAGTCAKVDGDVSSVYEGSWAGKLSFVYQSAAEIEKPKDRQVFVCIRNDHFEFLYVNDDGLQRIYSGRFVFQRNGASAVAYAMETGRIGKTSWIETFNFSLTLRDDNQLMVNLFRVVNNLNILQTNPESKFSQAAVGVLERQQ